jgi:LacI family transcriptional regulator
MGYPTLNRARTIAAEAPARPQSLIVLVTGSASDLAEGPFEVLTEQARARGWRLLDLGLTDGSLRGEIPPAGALTTVLPDNPRVAELRERGCPVVRVGRLAHPDDPSVPAVLPDWRLAGGMAADHFAERGFRELALFGHESMAAAPLIEAGLRERAKALGCAYHRYLMPSRDAVAPRARPDQERHEQRDLAITRWLEALPKPLALLACSTHYAGMVSIMGQRAGLAVPEDIAVLAVGDQPAVCELASVPISAVDTGRRPMMEVAIDLLDRRMRGHAIPPRTYVAPTAIVTRRSTDILAVHHPLVARAIRFLWDRLDREVSVDDVAEAMRLPRYKLERLFRDHYTHGIHAELRRARLERFARLLRTTDLPVRELAPRVGFKSPKFLHDSFCKEYGTTPRQYRLQAKR